MHVLIGIMLCVLNYEGSYMILAPMPGAQLQLGMHLSFGLAHVSGVVSHARAGYP